MQSQNIRSKVTAMAQGFLGRQKEKKDRIKRILNIFTWSQETHRIPWILVVGPKASGKSTFIQAALSLLCNESSAEYSRPDSDQQDQWKLFTTPDSPAPQIIFQEKTVTTENDVIDVQHLLGENEADPLVCFVVMVMKASWKLPGKTNDRDWMLKIQQVVTDSGSPSCLLLTHADKIFKQLSEITKTKSLRDVDILDRETQNRICFVGVDSRPRPRSRSAYSDADKLYITALEAIAADAKQRVNDDLQKYSESETTAACASGNVEKNETSVFINAWDAARTLTEHMELKGSHAVPSEENLPPDGNFRNDADYASSPPASGCHDGATPITTDAARTTSASSNAICPAPDSTSDVKLHKEIQQAQVCAICRRFMDTNTDSHVICRRIDARLDKKNKNVPEDDLKEFFQTVNGLLNTLEGGSICVHLDSSLHGQFLHQISNKLTEMLPVGSSWNDTYSDRQDKDHVFFSVAAACRGGRPLSTFNFKVKLSRNVGLKPATQDDVKALVRNAQGEAMDFPYTHVKDPQFVQGQLLPEYFGENAKRQMKAVYEKDINNAKGDNRANKFATFAIEKLKIADYICAFATMKSGGCVYLGLSEEKKQQPKDDKENSVTSSSSAVSRGEIATGRFICDGIKLEDGERSYFRDRIRRLVEKMRFFPRENSDRDIVEVSFLPVEAEDKSPDVCVVKITVKYFHGITWPEGAEPQAFRVTRERDGRNSTVVQVQYNEWLEAFTADIQPKTK